MDAENHIEEHNSVRRIRREGVPQTVGSKFN